MRNNLESLRGKWHNLILVLKCHSECCDGEEGGGKCQNRGTSKNNSELSKWEMRVVQTKVVVAEVEKADI